ncbi:MAG: nucleotidyltransferase family protein [Vicinamibacterales bacterium]|jgi:hypothetical protein|nr:nucleotidyltransferase family protein [Vicinamibacterales bacterium]
MTTTDLVQAKREEILRIAERHGARNVRVFGSVARGEATDESDIDLLVSTTEHTSPWFPAGLMLDLQDLLGRKVDVVTEDGLYWLLKPRILQEARPLGQRTRASISRTSWSGQAALRFTSATGTTPS